MDIKTGYKTTEFWVSLSTAIFGILVTVGVFSPEQAGDLSASVGTIAGSVITAVSTIGYALSRAKTKSLPPKSE